MSERFAWEAVETFPSADPARLARWESLLATAKDGPTRARALIGRALSNYWTVQQGVVDRSWQDVADEREADVSEAIELARCSGRADLLAAALLGWLYALWGPDHLEGRGPVIDELVEMREQVSDEELRLRIYEWAVLACLDAGDLDGARVVVAHFSAEASDTELVLFHRRQELWLANLALLEGRIDEAVGINQDAISSTADTAGSPFSFQNVAITMAIERFFARGLEDLVDAIRSIRASSPRVAPNWDTGLAFALAESGSLSEARELFEDLAVDRFAAVPRDLNWLVTTQLLGLIALRLDDRARIAELYAALRPYAELDATHGSGYASYGPVGRVVGMLAARVDHHDDAARCFDDVLSSRAPGPWTSLTRLDRAETLRETAPLSALADARQAEAELRAFGVDAWADEACRLRICLQLEGRGAPIAVRSSETWKLAHRSGTATVPAGVGMGQLIELLAHPGRLLSAVRLEGTAPELPQTAPSSPSLDAEARRAYRSRLDELHARDGSLSAEETAEVRMIRSELLGATWVRSDSAELERARVRVTKAIRRVIERVGDESPGLGAHLAESVSTGARCVYAPSDGTAWEIVQQN